MAAARRTDFNVTSDAIGKRVAMRSAVSVATSVLLRARSAVTMSWA